MIKKYSIVLILLFCTPLFGMQSNEFLLSAKKKKRDNKLFLAFLDQNVKNGSYTKEKQQKIDTYHAKKQTEPNVNIETLIGAYQTIQGIKSISLINDDISNDSKPIASMKYSIANKTCTISFIATDPEFQRQGYGSLLLTDLEQELRQCGCCKKISLIAIYTAAGFYDKHGFVTKNTFGRKIKKLD